ncbi:MAG: hypothetical protein ACK4N5_23620 [Myxococcales bacterium]
MELIAWGMITVPERRGAAAALCAELAVPVTVAVDRERDVLRNELRVLRRLLALGGGATWLVVLEDDIILCRDFVAEATARLTDARATDKRIVSFYSARRVVAAATARGERWVRLQPRAFRNTQAVAWTPALAAAFLAWAPARLGAYRNWTDVLIGDFLAARGEPMWLTAPSLVDHRTDLPSTLGHPVRVGGRPRVAAAFLDHMRAAR